MANTLSIMNAIRNVVSKQRIRYTDHGFDLDLAYICKDIIAMGYPAENLEAMYRNHIEQVYQFFDNLHKDHYKIYNLCSERSYDVNKFHGRVAVYPFDDHNPPTIELIQDFCDDVDHWLKEHKENVAAVHCKAGKGRTGTMICCYLLHSKFKETAEEALAFYDEKRTKDKKGVTIPSQRRYVYYYSQLIRTGQRYERRTVQICEIRFSSAPLFHTQGPVHCVISALSNPPDQSNNDKFQTLKTCNVDFRKSTNIEIEDPVSVTGDIKLEVYHKILGKKEKYFHFWFNTFFVCGDSVCIDDKGETKYVYTLSKHELDDAHKDKDNKIFPEDFKVQVIFRNNFHPIYVQSNENSHNNHQVGQNQQQKQNQLCENVTLGVLPTSNSTGNNIMHPIRKNHHQRYNRQPLHYQITQQPQQQQVQSLQQRQQHTLVQTADLLQNQNQQLSQRNHNFNRNVNEIVGHFPHNGEEVSLEGQSQKKDLSFHANSNEVNIRETPSVSPDVSRSNSTSGSSNSSNSGDASTIGEDWESGEFVIKPKNNMIMDEKTNCSIVSSHLLTSKRSSSRFKVRRNKNNLKLKSSFSNKTIVNTSNNYNSNLYAASSKLNSVTSKPTLQEFKTKLNNSKMHFGQHSGINNSKKRDRMTVFRKMRWLSNVKSDPDLCEAIAKSVNFRNQLGKKASEIILDVNSHSSNILNENDDYYSSLCDKQLSFDISPSKSSFNTTLARKDGDKFLNHVRSSREKSEQDAKDIAMKKLVVAKPVESHSIGFNVSNDGSMVHNSPCEPNQNAIRPKVKASKNISNSTGNHDKQNEAGYCSERFSNCSSSDKILKKSSLRDNLSKEKFVCDTPQSLVMLSTITSSSPPARMSNRCVPFSFKEIRQELQSVIKQNTNRPKISTRENTARDDNNTNNTRFSLVGGSKNKNLLSPATSSCNVDNSKRKDT